MAKTFFSVGASLVALVVFELAGCGSDTNTDSPTKTDSSSDSAGTSQWTLSYDGVAQPGPPLEFGASTADLDGKPAVWLHVSRTLEASGGRVDAGGKAYLDLYIDATAVVPSSDATTLTADESATFTPMGGKRYADSYTTQFQAGPSQSPALLGVVLSEGSFSSLYGKQTQKTSGQITLQRMAGGQVRVAFDLTVVGAVPLHAHGFGQSVTAKAAGNFVVAWP